MQNEQLELFSYCKWYLNSIFSAYTFNFDYKRELSTSLDLFLECIKKLECGKIDDEKFLDDIKSKIMNNLNVLKNLIFTTKMDEKLTKFLKFYSYICFNINYNLFNDNLIKSNCDFIQRSMDDFFTLSETIQLFKTTSTILNDWKKYLPPSFRLSEHYYSLIREE